MYSSVRESSSAIIGNETITTTIFTVYEHFSGMIYTHGRKNLVDIFKIAPLFEDEGKRNFEGVLITNDGNFKLTIRKFDSEISGILRNHPWMTTDMIAYIAELFNQYTITVPVINSNRNLHIHAPTIVFGSDGGAGFIGAPTRKHCGADGRCVVNWISTGESYAGIKTYHIGTPNGDAAAVKQTPWKIKVVRCNNLGVFSSIDTVVDSLKTRIDEESSSIDSIDVIVGRIVERTNLMCKEHGINLEVFPYVNNEENKLTFVVAQRFKSPYNIFISRGHLLLNSVLDIAKDATSYCRQCCHYSKCVTVTK